MKIFFNFHSKQSENLNLAAKELISFLYDIWKVNKFAPMTTYFFTH